jgi:transcriptional regulator with XRE-family HTH domain
MMEQEDDLSRVIGQRIGRQRETLKLTLDDVATRTGVSRAMISRIERGEVHASAVVLDKLCAGLGLTLSSLFAREESSPLLKRDEQPVWRDPATQYLRRDVAPPGTGSPVRIVEVEFPANTELSFEPSQHRAIEQHVWVLEGQMEITLGGMPYQLGPGDCLHMRPDRGIRFRNPGDVPARYAVILTLESLP